MGCRALMDEPAYFTFALYSCGLRFALRGNCSCARGCSRLCSLPRAPFRADYDFHPALRQFCGCATELPALERRSRWVSNQDQDEARRGPNRSTGVLDKHTRWCSHPPRRLPSGPLARPDVIVVREADRRAAVLAKSDACPRGPTRRRQPSCPQYGNNRRQQGSDSPLAAGKEGVFTARVLGCTTNPRTAGVIHATTPSLHRWP